VRSAANSRPVGHFFERQSAPEPGDDDLAQLQRQVAEQAGRLAGVETVVNRGKLGDRGADPLFAFAAAIGAAEIGEGLVAHDPVPTTGHSLGRRRLLR